MVLITEADDEPEQPAEVKQRESPEARPRGARCDESAGASTSGRSADQLVQPAAAEAAGEAEGEGGDPEALKARGNDAYKRGDWDAAAELYTRAVEAAGGPEQERSCVYLANRAACRLQQKLYHEVVSDCTACLKLKPDYVKALARRAEAHRALGGELEHLERALADAQRAVELDPSNAAAARLAAEVRPELAARQERLKEEMLGKLKDLGNMVLGKVGLSLDNFKVEKDPETGSYSVQFVNGGGGGQGDGGGGEPTREAAEPLAAEPLPGTDPDF